MNGAGLSADTLFRFGDRMRVEILQGSILTPERAVSVVVSTDDNYLTMGSGVSAVLRQQAGSMEYVREAQAQSPLKAGAVAVTRSYGLKEALGVDYVFHGAVVDFDTNDLRLPEIVEQVTANCLDEAEARRLPSILFPALATGAGKLSMEECARRMCGSIKAFAAQERIVKDIYIILHAPASDKASDVSRHDDLRRRFIREANLVLGVPYDPALRTRQIRDFYGGEEALKFLTEIITGEHDTAEGKQHAVILGGPMVGKWALLEHLYYLGQRPDSPLAAGRKLVKLTFGRVHERTPASFVYRKFLWALEQAEQAGLPESQRLVDQIREVYSDPNLDCRVFLDFLEQHKDHYGEVVFLIDKLPRLLQMEARDAEEVTGVQAFWKDLDQLQTRVRFIYTARPADYDQLRGRRIDPYTTVFQQHVAQSCIACVTDEARARWVDELFIRYLNRPGSAPRFVQERFEAEAGRHPYLISLFGHALVEALKHDALTNLKHPAKYTREFMARFFQAACNRIDEPRRAFFELLMALSTTDERDALKTLAWAEAIEEEKRALIHDLGKGSGKAAARWQELEAQGDLRKALDVKTLRWLEAQGYLVDVDTRSSFMARSFGAWVGEYFGIRRSRQTDDQPVDVQISLLNVAEPRGMQTIRTMFRGRGARIISAQKELNQDDKRSFMEGLSACINHLLYPVSHPDPGWLQDPEQVGNFVLAQFATSEIKRYLQDPPAESTILFEVDDTLKDIPWELMLETAYAGEIPFRVGRRIIGQQPANVSPVVRGRGKIKALLIGDPTDDLPEARAETEWLAEMFRNDSRFDGPDVLIGSQQCRPAPILGLLGSKKYGLIHYSGHSKFDGYRSAWLLADGQTITTDRLTSALQMGPPALVFCASCESAAGGPPRPIKYENQAFDLPSAFLQAGVEAYIGTLWEVDSAAAHRFVVDFYTAFLDGEQNLGECLRRARWARKRDDQNEDRINWLSFILYGDPHLMPGDLLLALKKPED